MNTIATANRYRSIWISDIHLGTKGCKAEFLLDFLKHTESDYLYLVGDIIDCWRLRRSWYWAQSHNDVVQKLLRKARKGTKVIYVPGNHDEPLRDYTDMQFGGVTILEETIHETADGGASSSCTATSSTASSNTPAGSPFSATKPTTSFSPSTTGTTSGAASSAIPIGRSPPIKRRVKDAVSYIDDFEVALADEARRRGVDGVSAAISTRPRSASSAPSSIATTAIGSRAARPWWSIRRKARDPGMGQPAQLLDAEPGHELMRIVIVSDAWLPQVNGVVRTLMRTVEELSQLGHETKVISPDLFTSFPCPTYPEIRLAVLPRRRLAQLIDSFQPCAIHLSTEGPLGMAARRYCLRRGLPFTTAFHTRFPEYVKARIGLPLPIGYAALRRFHAPASGVMVATASLEQDLAGRGFRNLRRWTRGVDTELFHPARNPSSTCRARCISSSGGWRWRRTSRPS
jgi:Uncharacterized protein conserved in bacteria